MPPHAIAGPQTKVHQIRECVEWPDPQRRQILSRSDKKHARYPLSKKFFGACREGKTGPKFTKSIKTCYGPMPVIVPHFIVLGRETCFKKVLPKFEFWRSTEPLGPKFTNIGIDVQPGLSMCQFRPALTIYVQEICYFCRTKWHLDPTNRLATIHQRYR